MKSTSMDVKRQNRETMWKNAEEGAKRAAFWPPAMDIEVTSFCNFACRMCPHAITGNRAARHLKFSVLEAMKPYFPYCRKVSLQGDGEPFLNPEIREIIRFLKGFCIQLMTTTNLSVMDEELAVLAGSSFDTITISCDGCTAEVYEKIRKNGNFERFVKNLDLFMAHAGNVRVILNCVLMRQNICQAPEIVRFAAAHGIKQVVFSDLLTDQDLKNQGDSLELYPALAAKYLEEAEAAAREAGVSLSIGWDYKKEARSFAEEAISKEEAQARREDEAVSFTEEERAAFIRRYQKSRTVDKGRDYPAGQYHCEGICSNLYGMTYLDVDGNVTMCCFGKLSPVGNVLEEDFAKIWNGPVYQECRKKFFQGELPDFYIGCKYAAAAQRDSHLEYPFRILDMDSDFEKDTAFWENRKGREGKQ